LRASSTDSAPGVGVYLHVPFCARACPYCDFDFEVVRRPDDSGYVSALAREFEERAEPLGRVRVDTIYVGGGTPSTLRGATFSKMFAELRARAGAYEPREVTVEANPEHVTREWLLALRAAGATRVSLGVQSLSRQGLVTLGRAHHATKAREAMETIHALGLDASVDLIVGWPGQTPAALAEDIEIIRDAGVAHVSVYALTVEPGTPWEGLVARGARAPVDEDAQADLLERCERSLESAGFRHYEIASYAKPAKQAQHNRKYWRWHDFLGFGPSAASAVATQGGGLERRVNARGFAEWARSNGDERAILDRLDPETAGREGLWLGLRLLEPLDTSELEARFERPSGWARRRLARQIELGNVLSPSAERVVVAPGRWLWHDVIAHDVLKAT